MDKIISWLGKSYNLLFIFLIVVKALSYWLVSLFKYSTDPLSTIVLYRVGDIMYFPLISNLSKLNFGLFSFYENQVKNLSSFPIATILPHALFFRFFGLFGFILLDVIVFLTCYFLLSKIINFLKVPLLVSRLTSLLVVSGVFNLFLSKLSVAFFILFGKNFPLDLLLWGQRIPRPFVSEIFFLVCVFCLMSIFLLEKSLKRKLYWIMLGIFSSALLQGDLHSAIIIYLSIFVFVSYLFIFKNNSRWEVLKKYCLFLLVTVILSTPFFLQRIFENKDESIRLGLFLIPRTKILFLNGESAILVLVTTTLLFILNILAVKRLIRNRETASFIFKVITFLFLFFIVAFISLPISVITLGKVIHINQFNERFIRIGLLVCIMFGTFIIYSLRDFIKFNLSKLKLLYSNFGKFIAWSTLTIIIISTILSQASYIASNQGDMIGLFPRNSRYNYRSNFIALVKELSKDEYKDCKVIATLDAQLYCWWVFFKNGYSYLADWAAPVSDFAIEERLISLCKLIGMPESDFKDFVSNKYIQLFWDGNLKYQANSLHTFSPLSDYSKDQQKIIMNSSIFDTFNIIVPESEKKKLINEYTKLKDLGYRLDLVVLRNDNNFSSYAPKSDKFFLSYQNSLYRVWKRIN